MTSPPTQLPPLPFRLFSYCHLRTWCLKSCCWSLEHPNGYIWYSCTLMNTHCSYRLIDRERYLCMLLIHLLLYICTKTYLVSVVVQSLSRVWLFVTPWTGRFALPELWDSPPWPGLWSHSAQEGDWLAAPGWPFSPTVLNSPGFMTLTSRLCTASSSQGPGPSQSWHRHSRISVAHQDPLSSTISWSLLKFTSVESMMLFTISSFTALFSFCLESFPASRSFPISQLFASRGQSVGASASASVIPMNIQDWFPSGLTGLIFFQSKDFPGGSVVKNLSMQETQETWVRSLGQEYPLEEEMATHSSILA